MARPGELRVEGVIVRMLPKGRFQVKLANGHQLVAWPKRGVTLTPAVGMTVILEVSPCDVSQGRLVETTTNLRT